MSDKKCPQCGGDEFDARPGNPKRCCNCGRTMTKPMTPERLALLRRNNERQYLLREEGSELIAEIDRLQRLEAALEDDGLAYSVWYDATGKTRKDNPITHYRAALHAAAAAQAETGEPK